VQRIAGLIWAIEGESGEEEGGEVSMSLKMGWLRWNIFVDLERGTMYMTSKYV